MTSIILCMHPANETLVQCNAISHWLGAYTERSLFEVSFAYKKSEICSTSVIELWALPCKMGLVYEMDNRAKHNNLGPLLLTQIILGCPVVDHLTIITRIDNIGKLYGQRLTYLHNLQRGYCMQNYIKPQSRKKYRRNSDFYNSWSTCHPTWRRVRWSISTVHARISHEKSFCINYDNHV